MNQEIILNALFMSSHGKRIEMYRVKEEQKEMLTVCKKFVK